MLSPKAMAQPTMMMARLAVLATECLRAQIPVASATLGGGGLEHPRQWPKAPEAASPLRVPSHPAPTGAPREGHCKGSAFDRAAMRHARDLLEREGGDLVVQVEGQTCRGVHMGGKLRAEKSLAHACRPRPLPPRDDWALPAMYVLSQMHGARGAHRP